MASGADSGKAWTLINPTGRAYCNELLRLKLDVPGDYSPARWAVLEDGKEVAAQAEEIDGKTAIWVMCDLARGQTHRYALEHRPAREAAKKVTVRREADAWVMDNGLTAVRVPAVAGPGAVIPSPVLAVQLPGGEWVGRGAWSAGLKLRSLDARAIGDGTLFGKIRLEYRFEGASGTQALPARYHADITLPFDRRHVAIEESFEMPPRSYWEFDAAAGWGARSALAIPHFGGFDRQDLLDAKGVPYPFPPQSLLPGQTRMGDTLLNLIPRWSQAYDDGWFFLAHDGKNGVGALVCRASHWFWPYENRIEVKVRPGGDSAGYRCPTWKGKRFWYLLAGPFQTWAGKPECEEYALRHSFETLDKIHQEYIIDWPGLQPPPGKDGKPVASPEEYASGAGRFGRRSRPFFGWGPAEGQISGDGHPITALIRAQVLLDPDTFGDYWRFFSPENPNFATSWWAPIFSAVAKCAGHPQYARLASLAKMKLMEDLYHSVTLPGGAGQECPGYAAGAVAHLYRNARYCRDNLGFDLTQDARFQAEASFLLHLSHPMGDGTRRSHPAGDTHPPGPDVYSFARTLGLPDDVSALVTEELPGFGVVFRNRPGTPRETYFAFKSGPNRGHFHGDQLSFHYGAFGRMQLVDHHCSYRPRAGQEHMHNRVAFHTDPLPWANMDGYERVIAFKSTPGVDVAVGQVESDRLRVAEPFPPEKWDTRFPQQVFDVPLRYRRTVVFVKGDARDYFVIRDQATGPDVFATYCLHGYGEKMDQQGPAFDLDGMRVFVAAPTHFQVSRHDWQHANGDPESTKGLRLTTRGRSNEFITVLMPRILPARSVCRIVLPGALVRGDGAKKDLDVILNVENGKVTGARPAFLAPAFNLGARTGTVSVVTRTDGIGLSVQVDVGDDRTCSGGTGTYEVRFAGQDATGQGTYSGSFTPRPYKGKNAAFTTVTGLSAVKGTATGELVKAWYSAQPEYLPTLPAMAAIPGGVRVGEDEIRFAGGVDNVDDAQYVTVTRGGQELLALTGREIDMDRSQGDIGLFVPDAGYPFGDIPEWLIRQRTRRPDWYRPNWPATAADAP